MRRSNNPKQQKFNQLQTKWYNKLKTQGFKDIEPVEGRLVDGGLEANCPGRRIGYSYEERKLYNEVKEQYYRLAGHFLYDHSFSTPMERYIWELHSEGVSYRSIVTILKGVTKFSKVSIHRDKIYKIINKLAIKMKALYNE